MELVTLEKRRSLRWAPETPLEATLIVKGHPYDVRIFNYGFGGFGVEAEQLPVERLESVGREVEVVLDQEKFFGKVSHAKLDKKTLLLGIRLPSNRTEDSLLFTTDDPGWDLIEDAETIATVFADVAFKGPEIQLEFRQKWNRATLLPEKLTDRGTMIAEVYELSKGSIERGAASIQFEIFQTCHAFESRIVEVVGKKVEFEIPKRLARLLRRETVRIQNGANGTQLSVRLVSKALGPQPKAYELYDFSEHGISVLDDGGWISAPIGVRVDEIEVTTADGTKIVGRGSVASRRWIREKQAFAVGLEFHTGGDPNRTLWHNVILHGRYPSLSFNYKDEDHEQIWGLFGRSGYLDLKPREAFSHVFDVTKETWRNLSDAGTSISKRAKIVKDGDVVGHLQMDRIYPKTWCIHHLAIDPNVSKVVGKELYAVTTDVVLAEGAKYVFTLTDSAKPWNQRNYYDFISKYRFPDHNDIKTYQVYEVDTSKDWNLAASPDIEITIADRWDLKRVLRFFELHVSALERNACALTSEDLDLKNQNEEYKTFGLSRGREFLIARINGEFAGFARLETGTNGVNIFGLLDMLFVHILPTMESHKHLLHEALVDAGLKRFKEVGKQDVIVALEDQRADFYKSRGLTYIFDGLRWIALSEAARRYFAFSQMLFGHLLLSRARIHERRTEK